jgi:outer membrane protein assembly factor BamB
MKLIMVLMISFLSLFFSCKDDSPKPTNSLPVIGNDSALSIKWKKPIGYKSLCHYSSIYNNLVIFSISENQGSFNYVIIALDKTTGKEVWKSSISFYLPIDFYQKDNILYFESNADVYAIDLASGLILWQVKRPENYSGDGSLSFIGGKLWFNWSSGNKYTGDSTTLFTIDASTGALSKIHTWDNSKNDLYQFHFYKVGLWMHPKGDSILILTSNSSNWNNNQSKPDIIAWNLNADSAYFDLRNFPDFSHIHAPLVINNDLVIANFSKLKSINLVTLKPNWDLDLPDENQSNSHLTFHAGYIMTQLGTNRDAITWIDPSTGKITNTLLGAGNYYKGYYFKDNWLYYSSNNTIKKVDLTKHKIVWEFESPEDSKGNTFNGHMALDAANDLIYITDYGNFYCLKINK